MLECHLIFCLFVYNSNVDDKVCLKKKTKKHFKVGEGGEVGFELFFLSSLLQKFITVNNNMGLNDRKMYIYNRFCLSC